MQGCSKDGVEWHVWEPHPQSRGTARVHTGQVLPLCSTYVTAHVQEMETVRKVQLEQHINTGIKFKKSFCKCELKASYWTI